MANKARARPKGLRRTGQRPTAATTESRPGAASATPTPTAPAQSPGAPPAVAPAPPPLAIPPEARFRELKRFLDYLRSPTDELIHVRSDRLYHYTDLAALCGIVGSHDLWLTHSRYCNDEQELEHGAAVARTVLAEMRAAAVAAADHARVRFLDLVLASLEDTTSRDVYVCCFCTRQDLLTQWRTYGANGTGVSLEFDAQQFFAVTGPDSPGGGLMRLWQVSYDQARQRSLLQRVVDFGYGQVGAAGPLDLQARLTADAVDFFIPTFKNPAFADEAEARLIFTPPADFVPPRFRAARGMLIPYYTLQQLAPAAFGTPPRLPIREILIGPSTLRALNAESARMLLRAHSYDEVPVSASGTPYRG